MITYPVIKKRLLWTTAIVLVGLGLCSAGMLSNRLPAHAYAASLADLPPRLTPTPAPTTPAPPTTPPESPGAGDARDSGPTAATKTVLPTPTVVLMPASGAAAGAMPWGVVVAMIVGGGVVYVGIRMGKRLNV